MKFSIVTPVLNGLTYLRSCVGSVRGQTSVTFEHIIRDGGSRDGALEWLTSQEGLKVRSEADQGMYDAINRGWAEAGGDVLSWINVDEQYLPGTLAGVADIFANAPEVDIVFGDTIIVGPTGEPLAARREIPLRLRYLRNSFLYAFSCSTFFRRRLWNEGLLRLDDRYRYAADFDLMLRLMEAKKIIHHIPSFLALFGVHGGNLSSVQADRMGKEVERVRRAHRALPRPMRGVYRIMRCLERLVGGCYRAESLNYAFALDETPHYRQLHATHVGSRFTYERAARRLATAGDEVTNGG